MIVVDFKYLEKGKVLQTSNANIEVLKRIDEEVTTSKFNKYLRIIDSSAEADKALKSLNFQNENDVVEFCQKHLGEPKGLWKNTMDEQVKVLKRIYDEKVKEQGSYIRPVYTALGESFVQDVLKELKNQKLKYKDVENIGDILMFAMDKDNIKKVDLSSLQAMGYKTSIDGTDLYIEK